MKEHKKRLCSELASAFDTYDMNKAKKGRTINIQVIEKKNGSTSLMRKSFRTFKNAIKFLEVRDNERS